MKVAVRIRPLKNFEVQTEGKFDGKTNLRIIIKVTADNLIFDPLEVKNEFYFRGKKQIRRDITVVNKNLPFKFDDVFEDGAQNRDVFERLMKPLVHSLMDGYNCSLINYGATGTGKTHTILGNSNERGIAYLTMEYVLFQLNKRLSNEWIYEIGVTYVEVYNEKVMNLLKKSHPIPIRERENGEVNFIGLSTTKVNNLNEVQKLLALGNRNRTKAFSDTKSHNKQSNTIFEIHINMPNKSLNGDSTVKLSIVELGGSERNSSEEFRSKNSTGSANNNKSILTLKNCLHRLADGSKNIPFKDSILTKILKNSLNGKHLTTMVFNVSSSPKDYADTYNTLTYADKTLQIRKTTGKQVIHVDAVQQRPVVEATAVLKRSISYTISRPESTRTNANRTIFTKSTKSIQSIKTTNEQLTTKSIPQPKTQKIPVSPPDLNELTRWFYEIGTIYDALKTAVERCCITISKEKLLELRMRSKADLENCRALLLPGRCNRMAKVRVKSILDEITKEITAVPSSKVNYWKSRLQICHQQLINLHRKVKESRFDLLLEPYISMKEFEVTAVKAQHESLHIMKINAIYVDKTEIYGYLSILNKDLENDDKIIVESYDYRQSAEVNAFDDIFFPFYKNCLIGSNSKNNSRTKCNRINSRTSINTGHNNYNL